MSQSVMILTGHSQSVTCVRWGGEGLIYTSSHDRTVKVWRDHDVSYVHVLPKTAFAMASLVTV